MQKLNNNASPDLFSIFFTMLSILLFVSDNNGHYEEANVGQ